ncbi:hypothetical protein [Thermoplasma volcanium GSS1]|uniref:Methyltransferase small domain-containing protein n=1 Tax=Thermoplasma volcanium (strain ATCC 51530 / DSM 4299 / JCM 9571 / NBRC 15438 / GSS1) TaxID=273116 RepID=Q97CB1_THEVO|nr:HemK2/MTQ2 family protein methyltransferase [Thermoplasma volcanium]BAB59333.1 hypothetical protein [Thermoplasma volcanium GSS1]
MKEYFGIRIEECESVYEPSDDTFLLMQYAECKGRAIEIGCGTGLVSIYFKKRGCNIECVDLNQSAVDCTKRNAEINGVSLNVYASDLFEAARGVYDTVLFNAPYLPVSDEDMAWSGGKSMELISRFLRESKNHINRSSNIFIVLTDLTDNESLFMDEGFLYEVIKKYCFDFEDILLYKLNMKV